MKRAILLTTFFLFTFNLFCQNINYYNLLVKEKEVSRLDTLNSFLIVIDRVSVDDLINLEATYFVSYYKDTIEYNFDKSFKIMINRLPNFFIIKFSPDFTSGNLLYKVTNELKQYLINNYNYSEKNLIILQ